MLAEVLAVVTYPLAWFAPSSSEAPGTPVLLVHGLFHNASAWFLFRRRLKRAGMENLHTYQYNSFTKDFSQAVAGCEKKLDSMLGGRPDAKVIIIGHSLGGLVARAVAGNDLYRDKITALVTLGSPHNGSGLAWLGGNTMSRGLIPGREISNRLNEVVDPDCPKLCVYTLVDDFVFPLNMLQTGRPGWQERVCSPMGHVWMIYSREVFGMVVEFLKGVKGRQ